MGNEMGVRVRGRNKKRSNQKKEKKRAHFCEPSQPPHAKRFTTVVSIHTRRMRKKQRKKAN